MSERYRQMKHLLNDISYLYELSLNIGQSVQLTEECDHFFRRLMGRMHLSHGSLWVIDETGDGYDLTYARPERADASYKSVIKNLVLPEYYTELSIHEAVEKGIIKTGEFKSGTIVLFTLEGVGFMILHAFRDEVFTRKEFSQLRKIIAKFTTSIRGCLAHEQVVKEASKRRKAERSYRRLLNEVSEVIFRLDAGGNFLYVNRSWERLTGFSVEETIGTSFMQYVHPIDARQTMDTLIDYQADLTEREDFTFRIVTVEEGYRWVELSLKPILSESGEGPSFTGSLRDVTTQQQSQIDLKKAKEEADRANLLKSQFLANMSHEIRTPMNGIIGFADLLSTMQIGEEEQEYVSIIQTSADHLLTLINEILDFSKIEANELRLKNEKFHIREEVDRLIKMMTIHAEEKGILLIYDIDERVPEVLYCDSGRIRQVLMNLISNAIKFTEEGHISIQIMLSAVIHGEYELLFVVEDTGIGINGTHRQVIFEPFMQVDGSYSRKQSGTGLGLSISKRIVQLMGGDMSFTTEEGEGSTFWFYVQFEGETLAPEQKDHLYDGHILVADDQTPHRDHLVKHLKRLGMSAVGVSKPSEALEEAQLQKPDLVIYDPAIARRTGEVLMDEFHQHRVFQGVRFIAMTSYQDLKRTSDIADLKRYQMITKPFQIQALCKMITEEETDRETERREVDSAGSGLSERMQSRSLTILLVEDNHMNARLLSDLIQKVGWDVEIATNGAEGVEAMRRTNATYDLILMDVQMPVMNGIEAAEVIRRKEQSSIPIIAITAHAFEDDRRRCEEAGMNAYLTKPIDRQILFKAIEEVLFPGDSKE